MPELPEVETCARDLAAQVLDRQIMAVPHLDWPRMIETPSADAFLAALPGRTIARVYRRAKWVLVGLDEGLTLAVHLRMSGSLVVHPAGTPVDPHTHLALDLDDGRRIFFRDVRKFGRVRLLDAGGLAELDARHGLEPLSDAFSPEALAGLLAGASTRLKPLLLDQAVIAGLGNIYVDEALWHARVHPGRPASSLGPAEVLALHGAIREVLLRSLTLGGSSFRDYRNGYGEEGGNQHHFAVYRQTGKPCARCGTPIERTELAQRGTHTCPTCQPASPKGSGADAPRAHRDPATLARRLVP